MLSSQMEKALNDQLNAELYSSYLYLSMASYFERKNLDGFATWMKMQSAEEYQHALKFYSYVHSRGGRVTLQSINAPQNDWDSPKIAFENALEHEQMITGRINDLVDQANDEKDNATHQFLMWFVAEQVEEEETVGKVVDRLGMIGDAPGGLFMLDRELAGRASSGH